MRNCTVCIQSACQRFIIHIFDTNFGKDWKLTTNKDGAARGKNFHSSACNYERNLERMSNSSQSFRPVGRVLWQEKLEAVVLHITPLCSLLHTLFLGQVHVFAGRVKIVSHSSCRTSTILKYFCPLTAELSFHMK